MSSPVDYLEDFRTGHTYDLGTFSLSQDEIIEFATRFDPQPFHIDPAAAARSQYGGIIASGWHTASAAMRLMVDNLIPLESSLGSPGIDRLRWPAPVRPDVTYDVRYTVNSVTESKSKPDRGAVNSTTDVVDPDGNLVMSFTGVGFYRKRPVG